MVLAFFGGYAKHWCEAYLEEQQRELDDQSDEVYVDAPVKGLSAEAILALRQFTRDQEADGTNP